MKQLNEITENNVELLNTIEDIEIKCEQVKREKENNQIAEIVNSGDGSNNRNAETVNRNSENASRNDETINPNAETSNYNNIQGSKLAAENIEKFDSKAVN